MSYPSIYNKSYQNASPKYFLVIILFLGTLHGAMPHKTIDLPREDMRWLIKYWRSFACTCLPKAVKKTVFPSVNLRQAVSWPTTQLRCCVFPWLGATQMESRIQLFISTNASGVAIIMAKTNKLEFIFNSFVSSFILPSCGQQADHSQSVRAGTQFTPKRNCKKRFYGYCLWCERIYICCKRWKHVLASNMPHFLVSCLSLNRNSALKSGLQY